MSKLLLASLALLALASAQHPVPLPSLNLDEIEGSWYIVFDYNQYINNNQPWPYECSTVNYAQNGSNLIQTFTGTADGQNYTDVSDMEPLNSGNTVWNQTGKGDVLNFVGVDPINNSWLTLGINAQSAAVIARTPNVSSLILNAQIALLKGEGYAINATNYYFIKNKC